MYMTLAGSLVWSVVQADTCTKVIGMLNNTSANNTNREVTDMVKNIIKYMYADNSNEISDHWCGQ